MTSITVKNTYMKNLTQSPTDPEFVQNPYAFYKLARAKGQIHYWQDYNMAAAFDNQSVQALLKDRRFGREVPPEFAREIPAHLAPFYAVEAHSMLELEAPRHTRLRSLVLRAFTSRRIKELAPEITQICHDLIDGFPAGDFDLLPYYANRIPVIIIARLLGVPETMSDQLLQWSNDMVAMYQARRTRAIEDRAITATQEFVSFMRDHIDARRKTPADDLITHLIEAEEAGERLSTDELITTCIILLNAGHEATVHTIGNGVKTLLETKTPLGVLGADQINATVEEIIRYDPPVHIFMRHAYEDITLFDHDFKRGDQVALVLAAANRDPVTWPNPEAFDPARKLSKNASFGGGIHFCVGAPLARLELAIALPILFERCPNLRMTKPPKFANVFHFHGLEELIVAR